MLLEQEQGYLPSREEIRRKAAEIRSKWSENEYYRRAGMQPPRAETPEVPFQEVIQSQSP